MGKILASNAQDILAAGSDQIGHYTDGENLGQIHLLWYVIDLYRIRTITPQVDTYLHVCHCFFCLVYKGHETLKVDRSRILLRAPYLSDKAHSLAATCICLRSAQMIIRLYTVLLKPWNQSSAVACTWRQLKRITSSAYILLIAFWRGEALRDETQCGLSDAIALLRHERLRWPDVVAQTEQTLTQLAQLSSKLDSPIVSDSCH